MSHALIIVDVQSFFMHDAPDDLPAKIASFAKEQDFACVGFTVFRNNASSNFVRSLKWEKCFDDADIVLPDVLSPLLDGQNIFERAAYSAFKTTRLHQYLQDHNIKELTLCGVDSDACVLGTAFEAFDLGYRLDINFDLTFSGGGLETESRRIAKRSLIAKA